MNQSVLVSVVTPSFNQGRFIEATIQSVKNQTYPKVEHIICDGESTDETIQILKKHEDLYNLRWVSEPDRGQADAINKGFKLSTGQVVGWLNSDDMYFSEDVLQVIVETFQERPEIDLIYGDVAMISESGELLKVQCFPSFSYSRMLRGDYIGQPATFFRSKVTKEHALNTDLDFAMDYEFWLRLGKSHRFLHISRILAADRNHPNRKILAKRPATRAETVQVQEKYGQQFNLSYYAGRLGDKAFAGLPARFSGIKHLLFSKERDTQTFVDLRVSWRILVNQLLRRNRHLA
jgi:glycosyltransferase involved in cell wall biosynthesis